MVRLILVSGKGGVGKTTVAAATGLAAAAQRQRTLVLSFDMAHSLRDSFDLDEALFTEHKGLPIRINDYLDIQEIDVQEEIERQWKQLYQYGAAMMVGGGLNTVAAEEVAILPGLEDVVSLVHLNDYVAKKLYDVIILDCPPTGEALRFVGLASMLDWYVRKRLKVDKRLARFIRPLANRLDQESAMAIPNDEYFATMLSLFQRLSGIEELLRNPKVTTVRLVTNAEKMVVRETQRAFMYFCMYGVTTDMVVINKLLPAEDDYFAEWVKSQQAYSENLTQYFAPVPVVKLPMLSSEIIGLDRLEQFAGLVFPDGNPTEFKTQMPSYGFYKEGSNGYRMEMLMPFVTRDKIDIFRQQEDMIVRVGTFKRNILLPRVIAPLKATAAKIEDGKLVVRFARG